MSKYTKMIEDFKAQGKTKSAVEGWLQFEHNLSVNEAKNEVQKVYGKGKSSSADWKEVIEYVRENYGKVDKKELINKMCEIKGAKYSSMNHAYNYIKFAQEYARQEVEAYKQGLK